MEAITTHGSCPVLKSPKYCEALATLPVGTWTCGMILGPSPYSNGNWPMADLAVLKVRSWEL